MDFTEYQKKSRKTALYPEIKEKYIYPTLGLVGEAGELANKVKKIFRDNEGLLDDLRKEGIAKELGDALWYIAQIATELNLSLDEVAKQNIERLYSRQKRGTLHGDGDNR